MDKETIRKMLRAKYKYLIKVRWEDVRYYGTKKLEPSEIRITKIKKENKFKEEPYFLGEGIFYSLKDVKEQLSYLKGFNIFLKPRIIGL